MLLIEILDYEYEIQIDTKLKTSGCECYENKKIVLYSLDVNSVKIFLNEITKKCPKVKINFRQDLKGGDSSLKGAVQNADVVFMVVAAAQHSATNFIEDHIGANDLVKINRKGVTALRNAFEEWFQVSENFKKLVFLFYLIAAHLKNIGIENIIYKQKTDIQSSFNQWEKQIKESHEKNKKFCAT